LGKDRGPVEERSESGGEQSCGLGKEEKEENRKYQGKMVNEKIGASLSAGLHELGSPSEKDDFFESVQFPTEGNSPGPCEKGESDHIEMGGESQKTAGRKGGGGQTDQKKLQRGPILQIILQERRDKQKELKEVAGNSACPAASETRARRTDRGKSARRLTTRWCGQNPRVANGQERGVIGLGKAKTSQTLIRGGSRVVKTEGDRSVNDLS